MKTAGLFVIEQGNLGKLSFSASSPQVQMSVSRDIKYNFYPLYLEKNPFEYTLAEAFLFFCYCFTLQ